jgi:hypothetical protein
VDLAPTVIAAVMAMSQLISNYGLFLLSQFRLQLEFTQFFFACYAIPCHARNAGGNEVIETMRSDKDKKYDVCQEYDLCDEVAPEEFQASGTNSERKSMTSLKGNEIRDRCRARLLDCVRRDLRDSYMSNVCLALPSESEVREQFGLNESDVHVSNVTNCACRKNPHEINALLIFHILCLHFYFIFCTCSERHKGRSIFKVL